MKLDLYMYELCQDYNIRIRKFILRRHDSVVVGEYSHCVYFSVFEFRGTLFS